MRAVGIVAAIAAGFVLLLTIAVQLGPVQDGLLDRGIGKAMQTTHAELFDSNGLKVILCGTGSPLPSQKRAQPCAAVIAGDKMFIVDAGTGSWEVLQASGIPAERLSAVFLTHFHSDHIGDLSEVHLGSWVAGRNGGLKLYGPEGVDRVAAGLNEAYALDFGYRTAHHGKAIAPPRSAGFEPFEIAVGKPVLFSGDNTLKVTAFPVNHAPISPAVGYRFDYQGRSVVISGDTAYSENIILAAKDADLLIHEAQANHMVAKMQRAAAENGRANLAKILGDIPSYHTTPEEAAKIANDAGVIELVLTHLTPAPDNKIAKRIFMRGVSKIRSGHVTLGQDGMVIVLPSEGGAEFKRL